MGESRNSKLETGNLVFEFQISSFWIHSMPHKSPVCGHIFRFDGAFLRSKTGSFCALRRDNSFLFNISLAFFRLFSIFFVSSAHFPRRPGRFSNLFRAFSGGVHHRSTTIAYHNSRLVSRAKMRESGARRLAQSRSGPWNPSKSHPDKPSPCSPSFPQPLVPSTQPL